MTRFALALIFSAALPLYSCLNSPVVRPTNQKLEDLTYDEYIYQTYPFNEAITKANQIALRAASQNPEIAKSIQHWTNVAWHLNSSTTTLKDSTLLRASEYKFNPCRSDLIDVVTSLDKMWSLQMIDAFGKPQSGMLKGELKWVGDYDECLSISVPADKQTDGFHGRYAWLSFKSNKTGQIQQLVNSINIGACLPSSCAQNNNLDDDDLYKHLVRLLKKSPFVKSIVEGLPTINVAFVEKDATVNTTTIVCICIIAVFIFLVFLGTLVDVLKIYRRQIEVKCEECPPSTSKNGEEEATTEQMHNTINISHEQEVNTPDETKLIVVTERRQCLQPINGTAEEFLLCFSAIGNSKAIFNTSAGQEQLQCVNGIRFLSMAWVILGHSYYFGIGSFGNMLDILSVLGTWQFQVIIQGTYSVDTFFVLSGCLLTYLFLKNQDKFQSPKDWAAFYIHRYVRLTPVYAMVMFVLASWWLNFGNGPLWSQYGSVACTKTWWWNLLYINNFVDAQKMCMGWSWFLANDMQFFVISPLFLIGFKWKKMAGLVVVLALLLASWTATGVICRIHNFGVIFGNADNATSVLQQQQSLDLFNLLYIKPYTRIGPYLIGVLLGFALYEVKGKDNILNKYLVALGWVTSQSLSLILIYGLLHSNMGPITQSAYNTLSRSAWGISVSWVIFACLNGYGGPINTILSWKVFIPLSRLTYCAYLVHPMIMTWYYTTLKTTLVFTHSTVVILYLGFIMLSYGLAFLTSLVFEAPIMKLEKLVRKL